MSPGGTAKDSKNSSNLCGIGCYGLLRADSARNVIGVKRAFDAVRNIVTVFDSGTTRVKRRRHRRCEVVNMKSGEGERTEGMVLPVEMTAGETCWFRLIR